jgi:hypothetical protein
MDEYLDFFRLFENQGYIIYQNWVFDTFENHNYAKAEGVFSCF